MKSKSKFLNLKIVIGCMLIQAIPFSVASNIQPQFISYVTKGLHFSLPKFSLIFTIGTLVSAFISPLVGQLYSKMHPKVLFIIGGLLSGFGFMSFGFANKLWEFYLIAAIVQVGTLTFSSIGIPTIINTYFSDKNKGTVLSLAFAGGSIGNIILQELVIYLLTTRGFKFAYIVFGIASVITGLVFTLLLLDFKKIDRKAIVNQKKVSKKNVPLRDLLRNKTFVLFSLGFIFIGLSMAALSIQYPNYLKHLMNTLPVYKHVSMEFLGNIGALFALFSLIGNLVGGVLFDKLGINKTLWIAFLLTVVANMSLILAVISPVFAYVFAITKGLSVYSYMMGPSYLTGQFFRNNNFPRILSIINFMFAIGFAAGSTVFAVIFSVFGFNISWIVILVFVIIAFILLLLTNISSKSDIKKQTPVTVHTA
ncbi:MAG: conjugated bile salt MFS transporter [Sarcina sp.]